VRSENLHAAEKCLNRAVAAAVVGRLFGESNAVQHIAQLAGNGNASDWGGLAVLMLLMIFVCAKDIFTLSYGVILKNVPVSHKTVSKF